MSEVTFSNSIFQSTSIHSLRRSPNYFPEIKILAEPNDIEGRIDSYANFSAHVQANDPQFQWYNKHGEPMPNQCRHNLTIGPVREEDFGFYRLEIIDGVTEQTVLTRWTELKRAGPRVYNVRVPSQEFCSYQQPIDQLARAKLVPSLAVKPIIYSLGPRIFLAVHFVNAAFYQWFKDGVKLEGCVCNTLISEHAIAGEYSLVASNGSGSSCVLIRVELE